MNEARSEQKFSLRDTLVAAARVIWLFTFGGLRDFVWADLREGLISLRGLTATTRALIVGGFALLGLLLVAIVWNDVWRAQSALTPLTLDLSSVGRGALVPTALVPVTMFLIAVAWSFALAGALHAHPAFRAVTVLVYEITAAGWLNYVLTLGLKDETARMQMWVALGLALVVPVFFAARWRAAPHPAGEFCFLLISTAATFAYGQAAQNASQLGVPLGMATLQINLDNFGGLIAPLLLTLGIDIANFARQVAMWGTEFVAQRLPRVLVWVVFGVVLALRLRDVFAEAIGRTQANGFANQAPQYLGALSELVIVGLVWFVITRLTYQAEAHDALDPESVTHSAERIALPLVLAYSAATLAIFLLYTSETAVPTVGWGLTLASAFKDMAAFVQTVIAEPWREVVIALALGAGLFLVRRGQVAGGLFLTMFGALNLWALLTSPPAPLHFLSSQGPEPRDFAVTLLLFGFALVRLARRELTTQRASQLLFLLFLTGLLRHTDFISSPFSPLLGFTGVGFVAFGLAWDALTAGAWANEETSALPRTSRILLYLGYILLTATLVNWALTAHDLNTLGQYTGNVALAGLDGLGRPLIFAIGVLVLSKINPGIGSSAVSAGQESAG